MVVKNLKYSYPNISLFSQVGLVICKRSADFLTFSPENECFWKALYQA